jgi:hypothetical protein
VVSMSLRLLAKRGNAKKKKKKVGGQASKRIR